MLPDDLPQDFLEFNARFGTDEQCRKYLIKARWPDGFRCDGCGHGHAYTLRTRLVYECVACRKQHSLLAGTIFEQTKTALARWFLAIYLVTSSKGGIAAAELQRQLGFGSYQTAWSWLHKLRKAMVRPDREPLAGRVEADETYVGGPRTGTRRRGGSRRRARFRRPPARGLPARADRSRRLGGRRGPSAARYPPRLRPRQALAAGHPSWRCQPPAPAGLPRRVRVPVQPPHRQEHQPRLRPPRRAGRPHQACYLPGHRRRDRLRLKVMERQLRLNHVVLLCHMVC